MLRSTETTPVPSRGSSTVVLSTSNSRSEPSLGSTSSSSRASEGTSIAVRDSAAEKSMLFNSTARRRPSLSSSLAANSFSARELATIRRPSVSVSRIGSVTALMIVKKSARSRRSFRTSSARLPRPRICSIFCPRTVAAQAMSPSLPDGCRSSSSPRPSSASRTPRSGMAVNGRGAERRRRQHAARVAVVARRLEDAAARAPRARRPGSLRVSDIGQEKRPTSSLRHAVAGNADEHVGLAVHGQADRPPHAGVTGQPLERGLGAARQVLVVDEVGLEQLEPRRVIDD